jgi:RNA-directed DNA polymerase
MWHPQKYRRVGLKNGISPHIISNALGAGKLVQQVNRSLPPIFSLGHLAYLTNTSRSYLRDIVSREHNDPYTIFRIRKHPDRDKKRSFRIICVPEMKLLHVQKWIAKKILAYGQPHSASVAYAPGNSIKTASEIHCNSEWMIKLDVRQFFESISEIRAYRVFVDLGYQPLVAFEMSRICTRLGTATIARRRRRWLVYSSRYMNIREYDVGRMGHLPQGAPTSPMLSNLAMKSFDEYVTEIANEYDLTYTRYADDLCLSTSEKNGLNRSLAASVIGKVFECMARYGLVPNTTKTRISPPGSRKVVLGLLVDGDRPRLSREFRNRLRQHIYFLKHPNIGPAKHAINRGFSSVWGLRNHIEGLIAYTRDIDPDYAKHCDASLSDIKWPL